MTFYTAFKDRLETFRHWPRRAPTALSLAATGFVYRPAGPTDDTVECFFCSKELDGWEDGDSAPQQHCDHSPDCDFAWAVCLPLTFDKGYNVDQPDTYPLSKKLETARENTFGKYWPHSKKKDFFPTSTRLARAGFYYNPECLGDDSVTCVYCGINLGGWQPRDNPLAEHKNRTSECRFFDKIVKPRVRKDTIPVVNEKPTSTVRLVKPKTQRTSKVKSDVNLMEDNLPLQEIPPVIDTARAVPTITVTKRKADNDGRIQVKKPLIKPRKATKKSKTSKIITIDGQHEQGTIVDPTSIAQTISQEQQITLIADLQEQSVLPSPISSIQKSATAQHIILDENTMQATSNSNHRVLSDVEIATNLVQSEKFAEISTVSSTDVSVSSTVNLSKRTVYSRIRKIIPTQSKNNLGAPSIVEVNTKVSETPKKVVKRRGKKNQQQDIANKDTMLSIEAPSDNIHNNSMPSDQQISLMAINTLNLLDNTVLDTAVTNTQTSGKKNQQIVSQSPEVMTLPVEDKDAVLMPKAAVSKMRKTKNKEMVSKTTKTTKKSSQPVQSTVTVDTSALNASKDDNETISIPPVIKKRRKRSATTETPGSTIINNNIEKSQNERDKNTNAIAVNSETAAVVQENDDAIANKRPVRASTRLNTKTGGVATKPSKPRRPRARTTTATNAIDNTIEQPPSTGTEQSAVQNFESHDKARTTASLSPSSSASLNLHRENELGIIPDDNSYRLTVGTEQELEGEKQMPRRASYQITVPSTFNPRSHKLLSPLFGSLTEYSLDCLRLTVNDFCIKQHELMVASVVQHGEECIHALRQRGNTVRTLVQKLEQTLMTSPQSAMMDANNTNVPSCF